MHHLKTIRSKFTHSALGHRAGDHFLMKLKFIFTICLIVAATIAPLFTAPQIALAAPLPQNEKADWVAQGDETGDNFGVTLAGADVNGDGYSDLIVGALGYPYENKEGKVYVYHGSADGLAAEPSWTSIGSTDHDRLGAALAGCRRCQW